MNKGRPRKTIDERLTIGSLESDVLLFEQITDLTGIRFIVSRGGEGLGWLSTIDDSEPKTASSPNLAVLVPSDMRALADALAPWQTKRATYTSDKFCHTCGSKTIENRPENNAPTFLASRHGPRFAIHVYDVDDALINHDVAPTLAVAKKRAEDYTTSDGEWARVSIYDTVEQSIVWESQQ